jgi:hypothetical protein
MNQAPRIIQYADARNRAIVVVVWFEGGGWGFIGFTNNSVPPPHSINHTNQELIVIRRLHALIYRINKYNQYLKVSEWRRCWNYLVVYLDEMKNR